MKSNDNHSKYIKDKLIYNQENLYGYIAVIFNKSHLSKSEKVVTDKLQFITQTVIKIDYFIKVYGIFICAHLIVGTYHPIYLHESTKKE